MYDLSCADSSSASSSSTGSSTASSVSLSSRTTGGSSQPAGGQTSSTLSGSPTVAPSGGSDTTAPSTGSPSVSAAPPNTIASVNTVMTYTTRATSPVTYVSGSETKTSITTSIVAVTSTHGSTLATVTTSPTGSGQGSGSGSGSSPAPSSSSSAGSCPASLSGDFQFPHLIVPVDKSQPDTATNTGYNGHFSPTISSIFNFDIPPSYQGRTCTLVFLFPNRESLQTSNYTVSGTGGIDIAQLVSPATSATTYNNQPAVNVTVGSIPDLLAGNSYTISSGPCYAGERIGYKVSATGSLDLNYFQDYNPSPIGLYITAC